MDMTPSHHRHGVNVSRSAPLVSVIVPAYNAEATIGAAITGVLTQTYPSVELVIVDDGSTDRTASICESYGPAVRLFRQENAGTAEARNRAVTEARGEFIALCDADDVLLPPYLDAAMQVWQSAGEERTLVACDAYLLTDGGIAHGRRALNPAVPPRKTQRLAILQHNFVPIYTLMPRQLLEEVGGWRDFHVEDWDLWIRAIHAGWGVLAQPVPHALYRWVADSKAADTDAMFATEDALLRDFARESAGTLTEEEDAYLRRRLATRSPRRTVHEADAALRAGNTREAARLNQEAAALSLNRRRLLIKAASLRVPGVAWAWRRRLRDIDTAMRRDTDVQR